MLGRLDDELRFNGAALQLRAARQEVLAGNLANAETPNYKARDFDFAAALQAATGGAAGQSNLGLARTNGRHFGVEGGSTLPVALQYRVPAQAAIDGNTVDPDLERTRMVDNSLRYEASLQFINRQISGLRNVISGQ